MSELSTSAWYIMNGLPVPAGGLRDSTLEALRGHPAYPDTSKVTYPEEIKYEDEFKKSPNQSGLINPQYIILHDSYGSFMSSFWWILDRKSDVSYHWMVRGDGSRVQFVDEKLKAWHAGRSSWNGLSGLNSYSVGCSFYGDTRNRQLEFACIDSMARLCLRIISNHPAMQNRAFEDVVLTHAMISPGRKTDTSENAYNQVLERMHQLDEA